MTLADAVAAHVRDADPDALERFNPLIPVAAGHDLLRQRRGGDVDITQRPG